MPITFQHPLNIHSSDIDDLGHVNNVVYLRWVQEVSAAHWALLSTEEIRKTYAWVVARHEIDYKAAALPGDELHAETWVGETEGVRSVRYVNILNKAGKLLAAARTTWVLIDAISGRPKKIEGVILSILENVKKE
jgi:acyl-CoA thioester hydrolase